MIPCTAALTCERVMPGGGKAANNGAEIDIADDRVRARNVIEENFE